MGEGTEAAMKVYTVTNHDLHYPVGCASIVVADNQVHAIILLDEELTARGLKPYIHHNYTLEEVNIHLAKAVILSDGNY